ncbi:MAG: hypothetical protein ACK4VM_06610 [Bosea sp. (in: a-proteobacteria)]
MSEMTPALAPPAGPPLRLLRQIAYRSSCCIRTAVGLGMRALLQEAPQ